VPFADVGPSLIPEWMDDEDAVLLTDALATGYFGAQLGDIAEGDVVAVFGAGPVGLFAAKSAWFMGAGRVIAIDHLDYRLEKARSFAHAETYNFTAYDDIVVHIKKITDYLGSDVAIDAAGAEADGNLIATAAMIVASTSHKPNRLRTRLLCGRRHTRGTQRSRCSASVMIGSTATTACTNRHRTGLRPALAAC
jgi:threonine dehydrogenase-like Zn-dependent dehydrogenase